MNRFKGRGRGGRDSAQQHRDWLGLVEVSGPFLSLPVLRRIWPSLDPLERSVRDQLRVAHANWQADPAGERHTWIDFVLRDLLEWRDALHWSGTQATDSDAALDDLAIEVPEHDTRIAPSFALVTPGKETKPEHVVLLGLVCDGPPTARVKGSAWSATPVDRLARLCRQHRVELGLATDGRWWVLVWAPRTGVTTTAVFDAVSWPEAAERDVVRAFLSLLRRRRFFGVPDAEKLTELLGESKDNQEEITEALGVQVRQAVELLVAAIGRADIAQRERGGAGLEQVSAHEVYRCAVSVMMRVVFLLFAEERGLLPSDNELYVRAYSAGGLCSELEQRVIEGTEDDLAQGCAAWHRLLALFTAVYQGVEHPRLTMHGHDGSLFDPEAFPWLPSTIDDRTVLHMLRSVQYVEIGTGRSRERRRLSFRMLDVEQIGYVYEGLLSFDGFRADDVVLGLVGKLGLEAEVALTELETLAEGHPDRSTLAAALSERYKDSKLGSPAAIEKKLAPLDEVEREEARKKLLAVTGGDYPLSERLLPYFRLIRSDLRGLPTVILPGALYVTESPLRRNTGTHYTPRFLAEEVVEGALQPLVYSPGPLQTANESEWQRRSSREILSLKVADIAMGSAAFLVAACRYLADHLVEAWKAEGDPDALERGEQGDDGAPDADVDPVVIEARRQIIEHCLYGVDINPMAVEMAKLSLWLVSMDPKRPFTFLDDRLVAGDSLLGISSLDQLEYMHLDPVKGRKIHERSPVDFTAGVRSLVAEVSEARQAIVNVPLGDDPMAALGRKRAMLAEVVHQTTQARLFADLTVGAALANAKRGERGLRDGSIAAADYARRISEGSPSAAADAREQAERWLATDRVEGGFERQPLHWPLVFPEVFEKDGFDAIIGNPPFLGGKKISGPLGSVYREYLVENIAKAVKGNADLVAYFVLRAHELLNGGGQTGLIATNTLAQGDTREVGLDQIVSRGVTIRKSLKSKPWPSRSAVLEYCAVWTSQAPPSKGVPRVADGAGVAAITTSLESESRVKGNPRRLETSSGIAFVGNFVNGIGFVMPAVEAERLIQTSNGNQEVLSPYLNGDDLNSRPECSPSRWIIDFRDWPLERAMEYPECLERVRQLVKPQRDKLPDSKRTTRENWWRFEKLAPGLRRAIAGLERVVVITLVSKTVMPVMLPTGQVFSHALGVFATDDTAMLALLSSAPHYCWAITRASTLETRVRYTPSDVFETFPLPELTAQMRELGERLDSYRRDVMLSRQSGLTKTYNMVFDPSCNDGDIVELRRIHKAIDKATVRAYGWDDLLDQLDHGFHKVGRETRYTIGPAAQREILDRLLELNHQRYAEEVAAGLHDKASKSRRKKSEQDTALF